MGNLSTSYKYSMAVIVDTSLQQLIRKHSKVNITWLVGVSACGSESHGFKSRYLPINGEIEQFGSLSGS